MARTFGEDFTDDVRIDRFKLEEENEIQPLLYDFYAKQYADAKTIRDDQADRLDLIRSQREMSIRNDPPGGIKITEGTIHSLLEQDAEVLEQKAKVRAADASVYTFQASMGALDSRKAALDNLVVLYSKKYYQERVRGGEDEVSDELNNSLERGKRE